MFTFFMTHPFPYHLPTLHLPATFLIFGCADGKIKTCADCGTQRTGIKSLASLVLFLCLPPRWEKRHQEMDRWSWESAAAANTSSTSACFDISCCGLDFSWFQTCQVSAVSITDFKSGFQMWIRNLSPSWWAFGKLQDINRTASVPGFTKRQKDTSYNLFLSSKKKIISLSWKKVGCERERAGEECGPFHVRTRLWYK